jgi:hypothetical protein
MEFNTSSEQVDRTVDGFECDRRLLQWSRALVVRNPKQAV